LIKQIIKSIAELREKPTSTSSLLTECVYGESFKVLSVKNGWMYGTLITDNYSGWLKKIVLGTYFQPSHRVVVPNTFLYRYPDEKSDVHQCLSIGSMILTHNTINKWAIITLQNYSDKFYIPTSHILEIDFKKQDWINTSESLLNTPYKWGGRGFAGLDCSALLQLSLQTKGLNVPRNTNDQYNFLLKLHNNKTSMKRGSIIFWKGHVGIMIDNENIIHANAFHMKTSIEAIKTVSLRILKLNKQEKIIINII